MFRKTQKSGLRCKFRRSGKLLRKVLFRAASSMNNMGSLAAMPVFLSSPPCPEAAAGRGRKD